MKYFIPILLASNLVILILAVILFLVGFSSSRPQTEEKIPAGESSLILLPLEVPLQEESKTAKLTQKPSEEQKEVIVPPVEKEEEESSPAAPSQESSSQEKSKNSEIPQTVPDSEPNSSPETPQESSPPTIISPAEDSESPSDSAFFFLEIEKGIFPQSETVRAHLDSPKFRKRLPTHYRAVGISPEQTEEIYRIQEEYFNIIASLQMRIDKLKTERDEAVQNVLTPDQKESLHQIQAAKKKSK